MSDFTVIAEDEYETFLAELPEWLIDGGQLKAGFEFQDFEGAIMFVQKVAEVFEMINHHPTFTVLYNKVTFESCTHDADNRITDLDFKVAAAISAVYQRALQN